jgi:hypothetical protein
VKDNTLGIRRDEADAYYRLLDHARHMSDSQLDKIGATDVLYINLMTQPERFRGDPVTIHGDLWRLYEIQAGENPFRFKTLYEAWIFTGDSGTHPYRVVFSNLPKELEPGENLRKPVRVTGFFFKREGYASNGGMHVAPTLLAHRVVAFRPPDAAPPTDAILPYMIVLIAAVGLAFLVTLVSFAISDRRAARAAMVRELNGPRPSFEGINAGPILSVQQQLQQIEEREWQGQADATDPEYKEVSNALHARDKVATSLPKPPVLEPDPQQTAREHRQGVHAIQEWTSRQTDAPDKPDTNDRSALPEPDSIAQGNAPQSQQEPLESPQGNGLSKLAAWENEIQQFANRATPQTEEQRRAQREVDRDRAARTQELDDRLLQERSDLNRQSSDETDDEIPDYAEDESLSNDSTRRIIDRADRDSGEDDEEESGDWDPDQARAARRRRRRDR